MLSGFPARSDQPRQVKEAAVIRSCVDAARTKDPELTQAGNSSTCRSTHLGRDKPITKQDALPRSEYQPRCLPGQDPLSLLRHSLCHPVLTDCRSPCIDEVEALTIDSNTTTI
ncbi:hypothetical protein V6N12_068723 [Hibiscus sabdariffa]|uniref:Uncharacterized protein n=1 Tax=Hibiscus sabdariffa TaxID=183260 RepID=A0ABR2FRJ1_9ROSI